jgi:Phage ABA sandwich domain
LDNTPKYISVDTMAAGPELEALAAEMNMGWSKPEDLTHYPSMMIDPQGQYNSVPQYSRDMTLAMQLIEKWEGTLEMARSRTGNWHVRLIDGEVVALAYARTLPHAICRAALKSVLPVPEVEYSEDDED